MGTFDRKIGTIVITGHLEDGLVFYGPFDTDEEAEAWAKANFGGTFSAPWEISNLWMYP